MNDILSLKIPDLKCVPSISITTLKEKVWYHLCASFQIFPGFSPESLYTGVNYANQPMDKYGTHVSFSEGTRFFIVIGQKEVEVEAKDSNSGPLSRVKSFVNRKSLAKENKEIIPIYQIQALVRDSQVYAAPKWVNAHWADVESKQEVVLDEDLAIFPDYSNIDNTKLTTSDLYGIIIRKGSRVVFREGGAIGNICVHIVEGKVIMNCNKDLKVPSCAETKLVASENLLEG